MMTYAGYVAEAGPDLRNFRHTFLVRDDHDRSIVDEVWADNTYGLHSGMLAAQDDHGRWHRRNGVVVDAGANLGAFTILAAMHGCNVVAIEPDPANLHLLTTNVSHCDQRDGVRVIPAALHDQPGRTSFLAAGTGGSRISADGETMVDLVRLDDLIDPDTPVLAVKMDIEGAERYAIDGARRTLARAAYITLEWHGTAAGHMNSLDGRAIYKKVMARLADTHRVCSVGHPSQGGIITAVRY